MSRLIIHSPDGKRGILEIAKPLITIGRGSANDLVLNDSSVSRFHAVLKQDEHGNVTLADRGSTNGVLVNGKHTSQEMPLEHGDVAKVGIYQLVLENAKESSLVVKSADIPSSLNQILRGKSKAPIRHVPVEHSGSRLDLLESLKKVERENYLLSVLYDAGHALNSKLSVDDIAEQVMGLAFRIEGGERGFMMLFNQKGEVWRQTEVRSRHEPPAGVLEQPQIILSRAILDRIRTEKKPILITDLSEDERFSGSESLKIAGLRSSMCAPLMGTQRLFGVLYVDNLQRASAFTQEELNVFSLVAAQAGAAIDNANAHEQLGQGAIQRAALGRFLSPAVVQMISANPERVRLGGVNQEVTVLVAGIRGFTSLSERMPPERIVEILNEYFTRVTDVIFDHGGTLDKYIGDAVMAVFGAPISKANDALNAVKTAMEIQRLLVEMNRDAATRGWPELPAGIGINTRVATAGKN